MASEITAHATLAMRASEGTPNALDGAAVPRSLAVSSRTELAGGGGNEGGDKSADRKDGAHASVGGGGAHHAAEQLLNVAHTAAESALADSSSAADASAGRPRVICCSSSSTRAPLAAGPLALKMLTRLEVERLLPCKPLSATLSRSLRELELFSNRGLSSGALLVAITGGTPRAGCAEWSPPVGNKTAQCNAAAHGLSPFSLATGIGGRPPSGAASRPLKLLCPSGRTHRVQTGKG